MEKPQIDWWYHPKFWEPGEDARNEPATPKIAEIVAEAMRLGGDKREEDMLGEKPFAYIPCPKCKTKIWVT